MRIGKYENPQRGFEFEQFQDAFARYLTPIENMPLQRYSDLNACNGEGFSVTDSKVLKIGQIGGVTPQATDHGVCNTVTAKRAVSGGMAAAVDLDDGEDF